MRLSSFLTLYERPIQLKIKSMSRYCCHHWIQFRFIWRKIRLLDRVPSQCTKLKQYYHSVGCISEALEAAFHRLFHLLELLKQIFVKRIELTFLKFLICSLWSIGINPLIAIRMYINRECNVKLLIEHLDGFGLFFWEGLWASIFLSTLILGGP